MSQVQALRDQMASQAYIHQRRVTVLENKLIDVQTKVIEK